MGRSSSSDCRWRGRRRTRLRRLNLAFQDLETGTLLGEHPEAGRSVAISSTGEFALTGYGERFFLWTPPQFEKIASPKVEGVVACVGFHGDAVIIVSQVAERRWRVQMSDRQALTDWRWGEVEAAGSAVALSGATLYLGQEPGDLVAYPLTPTEDSRRRIPSAPGMHRADRKERREGGQLERKRGDRGAGHS